MSRYTASSPPDDINEELKRWLNDEFRNIQNVLNEPTFSIHELDTLEATPAKPREGMVAKFSAGAGLASGAGVYHYQAGAWVFLG